MIKTILIIILSVTFFGVLFFILVRNALKKKLDSLLEEEKKKKSDNFNYNSFCNFLWYFVFYFSKKCTKKKAGLFGRTRKKEEIR